MTFLREEEKLARDVYTTLGKKWSLPIFTNIRGAEQRHMDHLTLIFNLYKLTDPVTDDTTGVFTNPELAALYEQLVAQGSASLVGALQVGATIEDLDIADIDELLAKTSNDHIRLVAQNLVKGSRNHMRAFMRTLTSQGGTYTPQYLSAEAFAAILAGDQERGPVDENGDALSTGNKNRGEGRQGRRGNGGGQGRGQGQGRGRGQGCGRGNGECDGSGRRGRGNGNRDGSGRGGNGSRRGGRGGNAEDANDR